MEWIPTKLRSSSRWVRARIWTSWPQWRMDMDKAKWDQRYPFQVPPQSNRSISWKIAVGDEIERCSNLQRKAKEWLVEAEDPKYKDWKELPPDPEYLRKCSQVCQQGFRALIKRDIALNTKVDQWKIELHRDRKYLSGRATYRILSRRLQTSAIIMGQCIINDLIRKLWVKSCAPVSIGLGSNGSCCVT